MLASIRRLPRARLPFAGLLGALCLAVPSPAAASDEQLEIWFNPSVSTDLGGGTGAEFESWQRFREGGDTHGYRLWLNRELGGGVTGYVGIERRLEGDSRETRFLQQLSYSLGPIRARTRLEQRDFRGAEQLSWRIRQRVGAELPLASGEAPWTAVANAEGFFTLRATSAAGQTGLTGVRTIVGLEKEFGRVDLTLGYLRQQNIRDGRPDTVAHAPLIALDVAL